MPRTPIRLPAVVAFGVVAVTCAATSGCGSDLLGVTREDAAAEATAKLKTQVQHQAELIAYPAADAPSVASAKTEIRTLGSVTDVTGTGPSLTVTTFADAVGGSAGTWSAGEVSLRACYTVTVKVAASVDADKPPAPVLKGIPCPPTFAAELPAEPYSSSYPPRDDRLTDGASDAGAVSDLEWL